MIAYKLFRLKRDNKLSSLFINKKEILPLNKWLKAKKYPTKGFAVRPGWHSTHYPNAPHLSMKDRVWCEVEIKDFEEVKRPESQGGLWYLSKWLKIKRII